jgi:hypothetical protein
LSDIEWICDEITRPQPVFLLKLIEKILASIKNDTYICACLIKSWRQQHKCGIKTMKTREIISGSNGQHIPVTVKLNIKPLIYKGEVIKNGHGKIIMDDQWIYVYERAFGNFSINVNRSQFCEKVYLSNTKITDSINGGKITKRLAEFIKKISDTLVFEKNGITYRVYLKKTTKGFDLSHIKLYWLITHSPNLYYEAIPERYKHILYLPETALSKWAHELRVDLKKAFDFEYNEN